MLCTIHISNLDFGAIRKIEPFVDFERYEASSTYDLAAGTEYVLRVAVETTRGSDTPAATSAMRKAAALATTTDAAKAEVCRRCPLYIFIYFPLLFVLLFLSHLQG